MKKIFYSLLFLILGFFVIIGFNYIDLNKVIDVKSTNNQWEYLFNGKDLDGWKIKINGHELEDNYKNTFKVKDGVIKVSYENYDSFNDKFVIFFILKINLKIIT